MRIRLAKGQLRLSRWSNRGSIKANIGHLEGGSGLAGIVKTILVLEKDIVPPQALLEKLNPNLNAELYRIKIPTKEKILWSNGGVRRASVNSFGIGGTNSHAVLDDPCSYMHANGLQGKHHCRLVVGTQSKRETNGDIAHDYSALPRLLIWSAAHEDAIHETVGRYGKYYESSIVARPVKLDQLAYSLAIRRSHLAWRTFSVLESNLTGTNSKGLDVAESIRSSNQTRTTFVFIGQGALYTEACLDLGCYPVFKQALQDMDEKFASFGCTWSLFDEPSNAEHMQLPGYSQPISTAVQVALVDLLRHFGVVPIAAVGHSSGEIAAAYTVGALSRGSAAAAAYFRGLLWGQIKRTADRPGAMMAVNLAETQISDYVRAVLDDRASAVHVACHNSPLNCTISGDEDAIDALKQYFNENDIYARKLDVGVAYHSPAMGAVINEYRKRLEEFLNQIADDDGMGISMFSSVTGEVIVLNQLRRAQYWVDNMRLPFQFCKAVQSLMKSSDGITDMIELGPDRGPQWTLLTLVGHLVCLGHDVSIAAANHQTNMRYWEESRLSRDSRLPGHAWEDPLGIRSKDWNPLQPRWRNIMTLEAMPWLKDHVVNGKTVFPGMGSIVMSIQAVRQFASSEVDIVGYLVKEAQFLQPIIVDEAVGQTETMLHLHPSRSSGEKHSTLFDVEIYSDQTRRALCFTASIQLIRSEQDVDDVDGGEEQRQELARMAAAYKNMAETCKASVDWLKLYQLTASVGMQYGNSFQLLREMRWDGCHASTASIGVLPSSLHGIDLFHPTVLDAAVHSTMIQASKGATEKMPAQVVHRMSNIWISAEAWESPSIKVSSRSRDAAVGRSSECSIYVVNACGKPLLSTENVTLTEVTREKQPDKSLSLYHISWKPALGILSTEQLQNQCCGSMTIRRDGMETLHFFSKIGPLIIRCYRQALRDLTAEDLGNSAPHIQRYLWSLRRLTTEKYSFADQDGADVDDLLNEVEQLRPQWKLFTTVARKLKPLMTGQEHALEVFFQKGLAEMFYTAMFNEAFDDRMRTSLDIATHERPVRILEVGAGSGGMTAHILTMLGDMKKFEGRARFLDYTYTDISPAFFGDAKRRFHSFQDRLRFRKVDLEQDALGAGFEAGAYDIVFAGSVLHATTDLARTLANVGKLLRPGGKLACFEIMPSFPWFEVVFGLLPGWWLSKEGWRANSPLATETQWDLLLRGAGFSGTDLVIKDNEDDTSHLFTMMVSTAAHTEPLTTSRSASGVVLVIDPTSEIQTRLARQLTVGHGPGTVATFEEVAASWNLHHLLPRGLDFFILFSSLGGIVGSAAQSNHAAGCTYQDSLARHRVSEGEKAASLDIGWMHKIGIVAETERYARNLENMGDMAPVEEEELLALLEIYCDPSYPVMSPDGSQVLIGVRRSADSISRGVKPVPQMLRPTFSGFARPRDELVTGAEQKQDEGDGNAAMLFSHAEGAGKRQEIVVRALQRKLAGLVAVSPENVDANKAVYDYGVDSLLGIELRNWIGFEFKAHVAVFELMGGKNISDLAKMVVERTTITDEVRHKS
ncbi:polyketide synthase dehydratase-domain-containing protein [Xylariomycetidae sp. FL2044]|nr:polyketide synthase dehydratase-domain-containing protein [Xylariomycetidae sp. FL2044]